MDKQLIERIAKEVAGSLSTPYVSDASLARFAAEFLVRIDAEQGKEAAAEVSAERGLTYGNRPNLPTGTKLFLSPTIPEGMALVKSEVLESAIRFLDERFGNQSGSDWADEDAASVADQLAAAKGEQK